HKERINVLDSVQTKTCYASRFHEPVRPVVDILNDLRVFKVQISVHEIVVVTVFTIHQILVRPTFVIPLNLKNTCLACLDIVVSPSEMVPVPLKSVVFMLSTCKGKIGPTLDFKRLAQDLGAVLRRHLH